MLTDAELIKLIADIESDLVEFTESGRDMDKCRKAICAFANDLPNHKKPGVLFVGIKDDRTCAGLRIDDKLLTTLGGLRDDGKIHPFPVMSVAVKMLDGCKVAVVQVEPSENPPVKVANQCWIRVGPRRGQASVEEERRLTEKRRWGNLPYDMHGVTGASVKSDLDMRKFESEYLPFAVSPGAMAENQRHEEDQLQALRLTTRDGTPTVTAILILGNHPAHWFPGAYIQFVRFDGNEVTDPVLDNAAVHGTLPDQLRELDKILRANIRNALDTNGLRHVKKPDYPERALRELARNAVIHRQYEDTNTPVRIYWFQDSIEISSPGSVYGTVTRETFGSPGVTDYRNPTIAAAMKTLGFMEQFGMGIAAARDALRDNGNPPPGFQIEDAFLFAKIKQGA